ncbi:hypothetical protein NMG60_11032359 [Bertholletia excelsa]
MKMDKFRGDPLCNLQLIKSKLKKPTRQKKKSVTVKYISSPLMVRASNELEFRAIVQELTGQNSDLGATSFDATSSILAAPADGNHGYESFNKASSLGLGQGFFGRQVPPDGLCGFQFPLRSCT